MRPGEVLFGTDSHTCMAGAFGEFATGIGNTDAGFILGTGKLLMKVPETMRFYLDGALEQGRHGQGRDPARHRRDRLRRRDLPGDAVGRPGSQRPLNMDDRMTIANMAIEAGGKNGIFAADQKTFDFVNARCAAQRHKGGLHARRARAEPEVRLRRRRSTSTRWSRPSPCTRTRATARWPRRSGTSSLDRAYIGSCTGGKTSDFLAFAEVVKGKQVKLDTFGVPATPGVVDDLHKVQMIDGVSAWQVLENAGVLMTENASCAACLGGPVDTFGRMNKPMSCISATNRNFPGRMGHKESKVYLASPVHRRGQRVDGPDHRSARVSVSKARARPGADGTGVATDAEA